MSILNKEKEDIDKEYKEKESLFNEMTKNFLT